MVSEVSLPGSFHAYMNAAMPLCRPSVATAALEPACGSLWEVPLLIAYVKLPAPLCS